MERSEIDKFQDVPGLSGMNRDEKARIEEFLKKPGKDEFFFLLRLLGKTPAQIRDMMIEEFIRRFGLDAYSDQIMEAFPSKRSWRELDIAAAQFTSSMEAEAHLRFWGRMRYVLEALPKRIDYRENYRAEHTAELKLSWDFSTCKHCWRRVSHNSGLIRKTASYCFKHNIPATHSQYRRHGRLARQLLAEQRPVVKKIMALVGECSSEADAHKVMLGNLIAPNDCLPRLVGYLNNVGHNGTPESLLWAFHGPESAITDMQYKEGLDVYIRYVLDAKDIFDPTQPTFILSIDEMSRAEAWLTLLEQDRHRKKS